VWRENRWEAAAFYSRQLKGAEQRYSATELQGLAVTDTVAHFNYYPYGKPFTAYTDHKPLLQLLSSDRLNSRLRRFSFKLQHWLIKLEYLPGEKNGYVDALSSEERQDRRSHEQEGRRTEEESRMTGENPDIYLAVGDVVAQPLLENRDSEKD